MHIVAASVRLVSLATTKDERPTTGLRSRAPRPVYIFGTAVWGQKYNSEFRLGGWKSQRAPVLVLPLLGTAAGIFAVDLIVLSLLAFIVRKLKRL